MTLRIHLGVLFFGVVCALVVPLVFSRIVYIDYLSRSRKLLSLCLAVKNFCGLSIPHLG